MRHHWRKCCGHCKNSAMYSTNGAGAAVTEELVRRTSLAQQTAREQLAHAVPPSYSPSQELRTRRLGKVEHHKKVAVAESTKSAALLCSTDESDKAPNNRCAAAEILLAITDHSNCLKCYHPTLTTPSNAPQPPSSLTTEFEPAVRALNLAITNINCLHSAANQLTTQSQCAPAANLTTKFEPAVRAQACCGSTA